MPPARPNFLFVAVDDLKPIAGYLAEEPGNFLQCLYPDPKQRAAMVRILTPNLDRLASQGIAFPRATCPSALCRPSRTALLTGIRTHQSGIYTNGEFFRPSPSAFIAGAMTLPQSLRA